MAEKINKAHEELVKVMSALNEKDLSQPMAPGKWPIRDMLAHLIYWNQWGLDYVKERLAGGNPQGFGSDFDRLNKEAAQHWAGHTPSQLLGELDKVRRDTVDYIDSIGPEKLAEKWAFEGGETEAGEFLNSFAGHQLYHCKQIQEWRTSKNI